MAITKVDYTTFTKEDLNNHLGIIGTDHLDFDAYRNEDCYLYKDYGVDYFCNFEHNVDVKAVELGDYGDFGSFWVLTNDVNDMRGLSDAKVTYISLSFENVFGIKILKLLEGYGGEGYSDTYECSENTWYYLTIIKLGVVLTCKTYSDSERTNLLDTLTLTLHADHKFRYFFGANTYNDGNANVCTLDIENLSIVILPIECGKATPHYSSGCELLLHYDADNDGLINLAELNQSYSDFENGIITEEEFDFVSDAYINGGINVICPSCWTAPPKKTVTFGSVPTGAVVNVD